MRKLIAWIACVWAAVASHHAQAAEARFFGALIVTAQTGACPNGDLRGDAWVASFRPANVADNSENSHLNTFHQSHAQGFRLNDGSFDSTAQRVEAFFVADGAGEIDHPIFVRFISQRPRTAAGVAQGTINAQTRFIDITGTIRGYDFQPGCTVTFALSLTKRFE
jgi:hypothetical protein